jgi:hypothetical protein
VTARSWGWSFLTVAGAWTLVACQGGVPGEQLAVPAGGAEAPEGMTGVGQADFGDGTFEVDPALGEAVSPPSTGVPSAAVCEPLAIGEKVIPMSAGATARWARFSPDARHLIAAVERPGAMPQLVELGVCTGAPRIVVQDGGALTSAVYTPDGRMLYFPVTDRDTPGASSMNQVSVAGGERRALFPVFGAMTPDVSGDGGRLAFATLEGDIFLYDLEGERGPSAIARGEAPRFAPDGKRLLFVVRQGSLGVVREIDLFSGATRDLVLLSATGAIAADYAFDNGIVVSSDAGVEWIREDERRLLTRQKGDIDVSADGRLVAITFPGQVEIRKLAD